MHKVYCGNVQSMPFKVDVGVREKPYVKKNQSIYFVKQAGDFDNI